MSAHRMKVGMRICADCRQKSVTIANSLSDRENKVELTMPSHICPENFVKVGPVHSEIIGYQGDFKETVENLKSVNHMPEAGLTKLN